MYVGFKIAFDTNIIIQNLKNLKFEIDLKLEIEKLKIVKMEILNCGQRLLDSYPPPPRIDLTTSCRLTQLARCEPQIKQCVDDILYS
jgi:hypothetical protein